MAQREQIFYLYDYANNLATKTKKIYSPYSVKTLGRTPSEDYYPIADFVEFERGEHKVEEKLLGKIKYDQHIEWLSFYNTIGGQLSLGDTKQNQGHINGRWYKNDGIHLVKQIKTKKEDEVKIKKEIETVEVQQIPSVIAENMNIDQLEQLSAEWNLGLPDNIREKGDVDAIKKAIIETMTQSGHIK